MALRRHRRRRYTVSGLGAHGGAKRGMVSCARLLKGVD
jgi:hypothetical protein